MESSFIDTLTTKELSEFKKLVTDECAKIFEQAALGENVKQPLLTAYKGFSSFLENILTRVGRKRLHSDIFQPQEIEGMQKLEEKNLRLKNEIDQIVNENLKLHEKCQTLEEENLKMKKELEKALNFL